jgi:GNAT superfamily N-acetyltransferase
MEIRRAVASEVPALKALIRAVVRQTYPALPADATIAEAEDWTLAWVAAEGDALTGVVYTTDDSVDELWIAYALHRHGLGTALLAVAEREIAARGYTVARLRCASSNSGAIAFYVARGWTPVRRYPHERFGWEMTDFVKQLSSDA